jgi:hypothetical protein
MVTNRRPVECKAFLNPKNVGDSFAVDLIPDMSSDNKVQDFSDYVLSTYVDDNAMYPPSVWAEIPSNSRRYIGKLCTGNLQVNMAQLNFIYWRK